MMVFFFLLNIMNITDIYSLFSKESKVITDSRLKCSGGIFFALKGESFDGNLFAKQALENGCSYAIIDDSSIGNDSRFILVDNVLVTLQKLARYHRDQFDIPVIGITGTNGKTTTKELINAVLSKKYNPAYTKGNFNNHIGVPLTLLNINQNNDLAIIEMGANHPFEIEELCKIANPNYGLITSIGKAHLEGFGSFENIIKTKTELYNHIKQNEGRLFVNANDSLLVSLSEGIKSFTYGKPTSSFVIGHFDESNPFLSVKVIENGVTYKIQSNLIGSYNTSNILAAVCIGKHFGISINDIKIAIEDYYPENNRSQLKKTEKNTLLLDAYNANPSSMEASLENFKLMKSENKTAILGEMLELGVISEDEHKRIYAIAKSALLKEIFLVGNWSVKQNEDTHIFTNTQALIEYLKVNKIADRTILIKGSRGNKLETIVDFL